MQSGGAASLLVNINVNLTIITETGQVIYTYLKCQLSVSASVGHINSYFHFYCSS